MSYAKRPEFSLHGSTALHAGKNPSTHCKGSWWDPKAGLDDFGEEK